MDLVIGLCEMSKKVPIIVPANSHSKKFQELCHRSCWNIIHDLESKSSKTGSIFVSGALFKVASVATFLKKCGSNKTLDGSAKELKEFALYFQ